MVYSMQGGGGSCNMICGFPRAISKYKQFVHLQFVVCTVSLSVILDSSISATHGNQSSGVHSI